MTIQARSTSHRHGVSNFLHDCEINAGIERPGYKANTMVLS